MKEIKFRGRTPNGEWLYGDVWNVLGSNSMEEHYVGMRVIIPFGFEAFYKEGLYKYAVEYDKVGQFTGLQDSKGNDIYEGDIVKRKCVNDGWPTNEGNWPVVFKNGSFGIEVGDGTHIRFAEKEVWADMSASGESIYEYEIIGNIHDNPELLEGTRK